MEQGGQVREKCQAGSGSWVLQPFWSIKPLEADTVDFSSNSCYFSASLHHPSVQAWEVMLEGITSHITQASVPWGPPMGPVSLLVPRRARQPLPSLRPCHLAQPFSSDPGHFARPTQTEKQSPIQKLHLPNRSRCSQ